MEPEVALVGVVGDEGEGVVVELLEGEEESLLLLMLAAAQAYFDGLLCN